MQKWEYYTEKLTNNAKLSEELNRIGGDGWELVFMAESPLSWVCVFKRPLSN